MPKSCNEHRVFIVNEANKTPFVEPKTLPVGRGDIVLFMVAGDADQFTISPNSTVFQSIDAGEKIQVGLGNPSRVAVRPDAALNSVHRYDVQSSSKETVDPILIIRD